MRTSKSSNSLFVCAVFLLVAALVFGLSLMEYLQPLQPTYPIQGMLLEPLRKVLLPGKGGGLRYQLQFSWAEGKRTAVFPNFELLLPETQAAITELKVGTLLTLAVPDGDFFNSPCEAWAIRAGGSEILSLSATVEVKRRSEKRVMALCGLFGIALASACVSLIKHRRPRPGIKAFVQ